MEGDYVFRYPLRIPADGRMNGRDPVAESIRRQFRNLLDVATPCSGDKEVRVDGFRLLGPKRSIKSLFQPGEDPGESVNPISSASFYEPRISFIANQLESLLSLVELEYQGKPIQVDGFRLRNLDDWVDFHAGNPADLLLHVASRCDCDCVFCYNKGSVDAFDWPERSPDQELDEVLTRLRYYQPRSGRGLFPSFGGPREPLLHPHILTLLKELRARTNQTLRICTNGTQLDRNMVSALAQLFPIYLDVSLNSSSPQRRCSLMNDPQPETAIYSLKLLRDHGIPFTTTIVAWPFPSLEETLDDLRRTAAYAGECLTALVQVNLPGYSRFFSEQELFDTEKVWGEIVLCVRELRQELNCPVVIRPSLFEENLTKEKKNQAEIIGVVRNSPMERGGLRQGDIILRINGFAVKNRPQARDLLQMAQEAEVANMPVTVSRNGKVLDLLINAADSEYPFTIKTGTHLGAVFIGTGFREDYLQRLKTLICSRDSRNTLLLTSKLVRPTLEQLLKENPHYLPSGHRLHIGVPENRFFGGNIILGDLLVVQDFIDFIQAYLQEGKRPDLVVIPSSPFHLNGWGRDLTGRVYLDIERETEIPVALLECDTIWD